MRLLAAIVGRLAEWACPTGTVSAAWDIDAQLLGDDEHGSAALRRRACEPRPLPPYRRLGAGGHRPEAQR